MTLFIAAALAAPASLAHDTVYIMDCGGTQASVVARFSPTRGLEAMNLPSAELEALGPALTAAFGVGTVPRAQSVWLDGGAADPALLVVGKCHGGVHATVPLTPAERAAPTRPLGRCRSRTGSRWSRVRAPRRHPGRPRRHRSW